MLRQDDGLAGIAVPLLDRTRVHGSINILWIRTAMTIDECAARYLADLKEAAAEIVSSLQGRRTAAVEPPRRVGAIAAIPAPRTRAWQGSSAPPATG